MTICLEMLCAMINVSFYSQIGLVWLTSVDASCLMMYTYKSVKARLAAALTRDTGFQCRVVKHAGAGLCGFPSTFKAVVH